MEIAEKVAGMKIEEEEYYIIGIIKERLCDQDIPRFFRLGVAFFTLQ